MGSLRGRLRKLEQETLKGMVILELRDGGRRIFSDMDVFKEMFLAKCDLFGGQARRSEVLEAVRAATPESRRAFEDEYGPLEIVAHIIAPPSSGGWVDEHWLSEDGTVDIVRFEGGSEEAERIKLEAQQAGPAF